MSRGKASPTGASEEAHTWQSGIKTGKLEPSAPAAQPPKCPECGSQQAWRDGLRYNRNGTTVQRWLCKTCGTRYSASGLNHSERSELLRRIQTKSFYSVTTLPSTRQVCVSQTKAMINLATVESRTQEKAAGATTKSTPDSADIQGKIIETAWCLKREGYAESTILNYPKYLKWLVKHGANLYDPENVKDVIARMEKWSPASKLIAVAAYTFFASINNIPWKPPKYKQERKLPFIPLESEIDALISATGKKHAGLLQTLKETGMRVGEACRLKWIDVDTEHNTITVNQPEKNSQPRMFKVSPRLIAMLNALPRENENVFGRMKTRDAASYFYSLKKRVAYKLQNPRINSIHLHTFRHWNATMEYHKTKDILHVMKRLGHKRIENTLLYTQLVQFESDDYHSATATDLNDAKKLIEAGFEYVCTYQDTMLFRKRK